MNQELLARLEKADPNTYRKWQWGLMPCSKPGVSIDLNGALAEAWLQACLQAAIRARKWQYTLRWRLKISIIPPTVHVNQPNEVPEIYPHVVRKWISEAMIEGSVHEGDTEAEALGWAYLAYLDTIEGQ